MLLSVETSPYVCRERYDYDVTSGTSKYLTVEQFCEELEVARSTFYEWRAKGCGPRCIRLPNGKIRIRRAELDRWLEALEDDPQLGSVLRHRRRRS